MALQLQTSCKPKQNTRKVVVQVKTKPLSMSAPKFFLESRLFVNLGIFKIGNIET